MIDALERHREQGHDEVFVGNVPCAGEDGYGWKTKRLGNVAYDAVNGVILPEHRPVFVREEEIVAVGLADRYDMQLGRPLYAINALRAAPRTIIIINYEV